METSACRISKTKDQDITIPRVVQYIFKTIKRFHIKNQVNNHEFQLKLILQDPKLVYFSNKMKQKPFHKWMNMLFF